MKKTKTSKKTARNLELNRETLLRLENVENVLGGQQQAIVVSRAGFAGSISIALCCCGKAEA